MLVDYIKRCIPPNQYTPPKKQDTQRNTTDHHRKPTYIEVLTQDSLVLTLSSVISVEAVAGAGGIVADPTAGAISAGFVTVPLQRIRAGGALHKRTVRSTTANITDATDMHLRIPWGRIGSGSFSSQLQFSEANSRIIAVIGAHSTLTSNSLVVSETTTFTRLTVADTLARALDRWMRLVGTSNSGHPGVTHWASSSGTIGFSPGCKRITDSVITSALVIVPTRPMTTAAIGTVSSTTGSKSSKQSNN